MNRAPRHLDKYELHTRLGRGNVGEVWKGRDLQLQRDVAIKLLHTDLQQANPHFLNDFTTGGTVLKDLHHQAIVPTREINVYHAPYGNETVAYIVMDYIEGPTLGAYFQATSHRGTFPPVSQIVCLYSCLGEAIDYAHRHGVVHGNIKPGNVLLNSTNRANFEAGEPMIADFGLCSLLSITPNADMPFYISPEQAGGGRPNNRSDIYALGVMLYEICTGVQPFRGESAIAVMMQHINALPTPPNLINPNIPPALSAVILRAMAKDPVTRFASASLLATAIAEACSIRPSLKLRAIPPTPALEQGYSDGAGMVTILGVPQPVTRQQPPAFAPTNVPKLPAMPPAVRQASMPPQSISTTSRPLPPTSQPIATPDAQIRTSDLFASQQPQNVEAIDNTRAASFQPTAQMVPMGRAEIAPIERPAPVPSNTPSPVFPVDLPRKRRFTDKPGYIFLLAAVLLLFILGGALASNLWLQSHTPTIDYTGHAFFQDDALGHNDTLRIQVDHVTPPAQGKTYYAWLETSDKPQPLGPLNLSNDSLSYTYPGDKQHSNLLTSVNGVLITLEESGSHPQAPSQEQIYHGTFDTTIASNIKNILVSTPGLNNNQSVIVTLFETIKSMNDKAGSVVDSLKGDPGLSARQATRIVEMIDGTDYARTSGDRPKNHPSMLKVARGLLSSPTQKGYLDLLAEQVAKVKEAANGDQNLLQRVQNTEYAIQDLRDWLQKTRDNAVLLLKAADLTDYSANIGIALQLKQAAADSYTGKTIPPNQGPQPTLGSAGALQAYTECQYMATLNLKKL